MILLVGFSVVRIVLGVLYASIAIIIAIILYKRLLRRMTKDNPDQELYCELSGLEKDPASGELEFYFTSNDSKFVTFEILNEDYSTIDTVAAAEYNPGQHIVRYDSTKLKNGSYFYQLKTSNQQTIKKMTILN